jgi:RTX calcium-binding nonapeptide repeat (4 copies)
MDGTGRSGRFSRIFLSGLAAVASLALVNAPSASAQEQLAASCEPPSDARSANYFYVAQVFTPQLSGALTRAEIDITKSSGTDDYVIEMRTVDGSGVPTSTVLAATTVSNASVPTGDSFISASFPNPANVVAGLDYALVVHRAAALSAGFRTGDDCPDGVAWFGFTGTDWDAFSPAEYDMVFRVFVLVPTAPAAAPAAAPVAAPVATCKGKAATIVGTNGANQLTGTPAADVIASLGGNDQVSGLAGNDTICGGAGKDTLRGGKGNDKLFGEAGKDTLKGGPGNDKLKGGAGKDKQIQ